MSVLTIRIQSEFQRQKAILFFKKHNIDILQEEEDIPFEGKPLTENELETHLEESAKGKYISLEAFKQELKSWN
jgi:hypothetical protein